MKGFIETTLFDSETKLMININQITCFASESAAGCTVRLVDKSYFISSTYEEVIKLIEAAQAE